MACIRGYRLGRQTGLIAALVCAFALILSPLQARADQSDPRLDRLFAVLHTSADLEEVDVAQSLIWDIWISHADSKSALLMRRGIFAMANGRNDEALDIFDELVERDPDYAEAWNKRATLYFLMGELDKSRSDVMRTLELEPRHFGALSGLGQIELLSGDRDRALRAFEDALDTNPHLPTARRIVNRLRSQKAGFSL